MHVLHPMGFPSHLIWWKLGIHSLLVQLLTIDENGGRYPVPTTML